MALNRFQEDGHTFFQIYAKCPAWFEQGRAVQTAYFMHGDDNCSGDMYVGDNAIFKCVKCGCSAHAKNWIFEWLDDGSAFLKSDPHGMNVHDIFSIMGQMAAETGQGWLMEFMQNLGEWDDESR